MNHLLGDPNVYGITEGPMGHFTYYRRNNIMTEEASFVGTNPYYRTVMVPKGSGFVPIQVHVGRHHPYTLYEITEFFVKRNWEFNPKTEYKQFNRHRHLHFVCNLFGEPKDAPPVIQCPARKWGDYCFNVADAKSFEEAEEKYKEARKDPKYDQLYEKIKYGTGPRATGWMMSKDTVRAIAQYVMDTDQPFHPKANPKWVDIIKFKIISIKVRRQGKRHGLVMGNNSIPILQAIEMFRPKIVPPFECYPDESEAEARARTRYKKMTQVMMLETQSTVKQVREEVAKADMLIGFMDSGFYTLVLKNLFKKTAIRLLSKKHDIGEDTVEETIKMCGDDIDLATAFLCVTHPPKKVELLGKMDSNGRIQMSGAMTMTKEENEKIEDFICDTFMKLDEKKE